MLRSLLLGSTCLGLLTFAPGCSFFSTLMGGGANAGTGASAQSSTASVEAELQARRDAVAAAPGSYEAAINYYAYVHALNEQGALDQLGIDGQTETRAVLEALAAVEGEPQMQAQARLFAADLQRSLGDTEAELALLQEAASLWPGGATSEALIAYHGRAGDDASVKEACTAARKGLDYDDQLLSLMSVCLQARRTSDPDVGLDFFPDGDRAWFKSEWARLQAEAQARAAEEERRRAEERAQREAERAAQAEARSSSQTGTTSAGPSGPVSVSIKNNCRETVKVFYGNKPKYGSGTSSSIGSNTRTSHSFRAGDMFWITDDSGNGISSVTVNHGMREIEITSSCTGLAAR